MTRSNMFTMMITTAAFMFASTLTRADAEHGLDDLCSDVISAIATADPVAYAQCFTTIRHRIDDINKMFPNLSDSEMERMLKKFRRRNDAIHQSFHIIRDHIEDPTATITFVSAESTDQKTETFRGRTYTGASTLSCRFKVNEQDWLLTLDDGILLDNRWFLSDDPVSLETPHKVVSLRLSNGKYGHTTDKTRPPSEKR